VAARMAGDDPQHKAQSWLRYRLLLSSLGARPILLFALGCFTLGFLLRSALHPPATGARPKAPGGLDPCRGVGAGGGGRPRAAEPGELVLVTGGSGFIGSTLVQQLLGLGYVVRVLDNLETGNLQFLDLRHPRLEFVLGDILDRAAVRRAMAGVRGVFHLAAASKVLPSLRSPKMATFNIEQNAVGTSNILEAANETHLVRKVVFAASSTYYGNQDIPFHEQDPFVPTSPYAASKYMGELEMLTNDQLYNIPTLSLRFFMVYGPRNPSEGAYSIVTGIFLKRLFAGKPLVIEGDGQQFRDFVHVEDVARACVLSYQSPVRGTVINIGTGEAHTVQQVADLVSPNQERAPARKNDMRGTTADTCRAKSLLHFSAEYDFVATMRAMIADSLAGRGEYLSPMWEDEQVIAAVERRLRGWTAADAKGRAALLRDAARGDPGFLAGLLSEVGAR